MSPSSSAASKKKTSARHGCSCRCCLLLVLLLCLVPRMMSGNSAVAFKVISHLPGFQGPLPFYLETGYVEVDALHDGYMFYYFIESERDPEEDPLVVWLTGGPGCSGLAALLYQIGPISFDMQSRFATVPTLAYRTDSWTKVSNIIFIDAPINAGFSYCREGDAYNSSDTQMASQILGFLRKWLDNHKKFKSNPLYIAGDSYGGLIVPVVTSEIAKDDEFSDKPFFNLKGYIVGNPVTEDNFETNAQFPFAHGMGLISDELYESAKRSCGGVYLDNKNFECQKNIQSFDEGSISKWKRCKRYDASWYNREIESAVPYHLNLTTRGYRALVYSGDHDMVVPYLSTQAWIRHLNFSIVDDWRPWHVTGQVAGYTRVYSNNLTFATIKGAGHAASEYRPTECRAMFERWIDHQAL